MRRHLSGGRLPERYVRLWTLAITYYVFKFVIVDLSTVSDGERRLPLHNLLRVPSHKQKFEKLVIRKSITLSSLLGCFELASVPVLGGT